MKGDKKMDVYRLINEVYKRPALWNQRHLSYHNREITNSIWMEIAALFKLPKQVLKTKWKGLRDTFRAEIKKNKVYRKTKYKTNRSVWIHFNNLQFLKEQMLPKPPIWERNDNTQDNDTSSSATCVDITNDDSSCENDVIDTANNLEITLIENRRESWIDMNEEKNCISDKKNSSHYQENLEIIDDLPGGFNQKNLRSNLQNNTNTIIAVDLLKENFILDFKHSDSSNCNNNSISNNQTEETITVIKLEPDDDYDNNVEFRNVSEEIDNVDNNDLMVKKITTEEVMIGESSGDNCVIGSQPAVDPLEVNRFDDNYYFLMSLLPHIRTLPAERRMLLRMQMQQLVYQEVYDKTPPSQSTCSQDKLL